MRYSLFMLTLVVIISCKVNSEELTLAKPCNEPGQVTHLKSTEIQKIMNEAIISGLPGVSIVVDSDTEGYFTGSAGVVNLDNRIAVGASCHTFRAASITKTFLATAIMMMVEDELLDLDSPINNLLSNEILDGLAKANETTIGELLSHTSGIPNYDDNIRFVASVLNEPGRVLTIMDRINFAKDLKGTPDWVIEKYGQIYSNTNYLLLELILESVSGRTFEEFISTEIVLPLQMERSTFSTVNSYPPDLVTGYCDMFDSGKLREVDLFDAHRWSGEAALISKPSDLHTFYKALLNGDVLDIETVSEMITHKYGLLTEMFGVEEGIGHDGQAIGYSSEMWFFPNMNLTVVLMANQGRISDDQPSIEIFEQLLSKILSIHNP
jgi:D-alanyl-D-alanine carboxypeptidase